MSIQKFKTHYLYDLASFSQIFVAFLSNTPKITIYYGNGIFRCESEN